MEEKRKKRIAGYVKLAKLWERNAKEARAYHTDYYIEKFKDSQDYTLAGVYIEITGNKAIAGRPEMLRLIKDCISGDIDVIATQTRAYLAANAQEFCYLFKILNGIGVDFITEDDEYNINTITNEDNQTEELVRMSENYISLNPDHFNKWKEAIYKKIEVTMGD